MIYGENAFEQKGSYVLNMAAFEHDMLRIDAFEQNIVTDQMRLGKREAAY